MLEVITTAGLGPVISSPENPRKARFRAIREALFKQDATDDEREDALEALTELSKE